MATFNYFFGEQALSDFRQKRLLAKIKSSLPNIQSLSAHKIYFVEQEALSEKQQQKFNELFKIQSQEKTEGIHCIAIPRFGTQSPWSSKVIDILGHCGLTEVHSIEQGIFYTLESNDTPEAISTIALLLHDPLIESLITSPEEANALFIHQPPGEVHYINLIEEGITSLDKINQELGLALSSEEIKYLADYFIGIKRNPSDAELMMFAQANSEHCRHKIFNAHWKGNSKMHIAPNQPSLFGMIKNTHVLYSANVLSAYSDNAAVIANPHNKAYFAPDVNTNIYQYYPGTYDIVMKVETHNHPTAIAPSPGAATGIGGELRDEAAAGRGAKSRAGLSGFTVSNLRIPHLIRPWEKNAPTPPHMASPLRIMIEAPVGAASFSNEYGRPQIVGYFRTLELETYGYHKPIAIAGGMGIIERNQISKKNLLPGAALIVLGGPAMKIGLGGGAASSMASGQSELALDFASVQRSNPEMQRRCQEVIERCFQQRAANPILSIHDVGAGGLSNALSELVHQSGLGAHIDLRTIPNAEPSMTPLAIWCNEAQERYVLAIEEKNLSLFTSIAERERCPYAVIGHVQENPVLTLEDSHFNNTPVDLPLSVLFDHSPVMTREAHLIEEKPLVAFDTNLYNWKDIAERILTLPCVASKQFLITIADRSVGGLVAREPMVGPWQTPVADVGVIADNFQSYGGSAMAMGERPFSAILNPKASVRLAITEALTNIAAASIERLSDVKLSANWMAACGTPEQDSALYAGVFEAGMHFCADLNLCIPVGKDSLSMRTVWEDNEIISPLSLIVSAFSPVEDIRKTLTPELRRDIPDTRLLLIDLGRKKNRLGASAFAQVYQNNSGESADIDKVQDVKALFTFIQKLNQADKILAYHDRSDGGLFSCLCEMAFAAHTGITVQLENLGDDPKAALFSEEIGVVLQIRAEDREHTLNFAQELQLGDCIHIIGRLNEADRIVFRVKNQVVLAEDRITWQKLWQETSARIQALRDNPECAKQEWENLSDNTIPGLNAHISFVPFAPAIPQHLPKIAILREQGVNGHNEMAAAFTSAGFRTVDVHMSDIIAKRVTLDSFIGLVACGGFSYGDVLGAGRGWASSILYHPYTLNQFQSFFARSDTFALGVCNGCQMLVQLKDIIPGAEHWPIFTRNNSEQFESRLSLVRIENTPSWFFERMKGSQLPIIVSHGEGRALWTNNQIQESANSLVTLRYVNHYGEVTEHYPENPNGSPSGCAGLTSKDGRFNVMMPHPERVFRTVQLSWHPRDWPEYTPWVEMFMNVRRKY